MAVTVDDTDLSQLTYTGVWQQEGQSLVEYNSTTHGTGIVGSAVIFIFEGTSVAVFGSISPSTVVREFTTISTYSVDGAPVVTYSAPVASSHLFHQQFFQSTQLLSGKHSLAIEVTVAEPETWYWLDYIVYEPGPQSLSTSMLSLPSLSSSTTSPSTILSISTQPNTPTSRVPTSASAPIAPIPTSVDVTRINSIISKSPDSFTLSFSPSPVSSPLPAPSSPLLTSATISSSTPMPAGGGGHSRILTPALVVPLFLLLLLTLAYIGRRKRQPLKPMSEVHIFIESQVNESGPVPTMISFISAPHEAHSPPPPYSAPPSYFSPSSYSPPPPYLMPPSDMNITS